ncbi:MAG: tetratricopeptide repeat protein, partial [Cyclobacteriaceae bacterium]
MIKRHCLYLSFFLFSVCGFSQSIDSLKIGLSKAQNDSIRVSYLTELAQKYLSYQLDTAVLYGRWGLKLAQEINYQRGIIHALNLIGNYHQRTANFDSARWYYQQILPIGERRADSIALANAYNNIAILYNNKAVYDTALNLFIKALNYEPKSNLKGIAQSYLNIGVVHYYMGNVDMCIEYMRKSVKTQEKEEDKRVLLKGYINLGAIFESIKHNPDSAIFYYQSGYDLARSLLEKKDESIAAGNLARVYFNRDEERKAKKFLDESIAIRKEMNDKEGLISVLLTGAGMLGDSPEAKQMILEALQISKEIGVRLLQKEALNYLANYYVANQDFKNAFETNKEFHALSDSIFSKEKNQSILELQTKYETEKKEQQIALQQAEISEQQAENQRNTIFIVALITLVVFLVIVSLLIRSRSQKKQALLIQEAQIKLRETQIEAALNSQESERKRFARDLHDGFGQMISVLNLNLKSLEKGETDRNEAFANSAQVLDDMYKELKGICFNLMPETLIKSGVIDALKEFAQRVNQTRKLMLEIDTFGIDERLTDLQEISIYRISQEWINNVLKYSDANKITLSLTK